MHKLATWVKFHYVFIGWSQNFWRIDWGPFDDLSYFRINLLYLPLLSDFFLFLCGIWQPVLFRTRALFFSRGITFNCLSILYRFVVIIADFIKWNFWRNFSIWISRYAGELLIGFFLVSLPKWVFIEMFELFWYALKLLPLLVSSFTFCLFWLLPRSKFEILFQLRDCHLFRSSFTLFRIRLNWYFHRSLFVTRFASKCLRILSFDDKIQFLIFHQMLLFL